jgi:hypothetical protein
MKKRRTKVTSSHTIAGVLDALLEEPTDRLAWSALRDLAEEHGVMHRVDSGWDRALLAIWAVAEAAPTHQAKAQALKVTLHPGYADTGYPPAQNLALGEWSGDADMSKLRDILLCGCGFNVVWVGTWKVCSVCRRLSWMHGFEVGGAWYCFDCTGEMAENEATF